MADMAKGKGGLLVLALGVLVVGGVVAAGSMLHRPGGTQDPPNKGGVPVINLRTKHYATIRLTSAELTIEEPLRRVADGEAAGGQALEAPADHPLSQRPKGTHRHLWEQYPSSFAGLSPKEKLRCGALKRAVEHDRVFAFKKGTAVGKFNVTEEGDYRLYMRVKWCCACGNSFYFTVDEEPLEVFAENGGTYGRWLWAYHTKGGQAYSVHLKPGEHTLRLAYKEDGSRLDQVLLTTRARDNWMPTSRDE